MIVAGVLEGPAAHEDRFLLSKTVEGNGPRRGRVSLYFDLEASLFEAVDEIASVSPKVIVLSEEPGPLGWIRNGRVLDRSLQLEVNGMVRVKETIRLQDPQQLPHRNAVVFDMLEDVVAQSDVERLIRERDSHDVEGHLGYRARIGIRSDVPRSGARAKPLADAFLGSDVQNRQLRSSYS